MSPDLPCFLVLLLLPLTLPLLLLITRNHKSFSKNQLPPSPPKLPIIGNLHQLGPLPHRSLHSLSQRYGPLLFLQLGRLQAVVVSSAEVAREIMKDYDHVFSRRPSVKAANIIFNNSIDVAFGNGEQWKQGRKLLVNHFLSPRLVPSFQHIREEEVATLIVKVSESSPHEADMSELLSSFMTSIVCRSVFGNVSREGMSKIFCKLVREDSFLLEHFYVGDYFPYLGWLDELVGLGDRTRRLVKKWDAFLDEVIEDHATRFKGDDSQKNTCFMDALLSLQKDPSMDLNLSREYIMTLMHEIILGATDTSFVVLEWGMTELVRNTNAMMKLKEEMREIANGELRVREEDLIKACYLKAVIKEVLRLHPSGPLLIPKEAMENCKVQGYDVPMKAKVIINAWSIGRDPRYWEAPEEFRPERFLNSPVDFRGHDFQFIPFGSGRRICPGLNFALPTLELAFANLINQFDWTLPDGMKVGDLNMDEAPGITVGRKKRLVLVARNVMKQ